jgi:hypothetical protein
MLEFLEELAIKNSGHLKNIKPPGLTSIITLANIFFCVSRHLETIVY